MNSEEKRVAMIAGGNSGIGLATVAKLAARGFHVVLVAMAQKVVASQDYRRRYPSQSLDIRPGQHVTGSAGMTNRDM